jgi:small GTP-binding protein
MTDDNLHYRRALGSLEQTLSQLRGCSAEERDMLRQELSDLEKMQEKLTGGRVEIVVFGEISTGKSALINALVGKQVAAVNVQGGWTKELDRVDWHTAGYAVPGLAGSKVVLVDTPGLNEVGGGDRAVMATEAARGADLILFVTDSDLNEIEYSALLALASVHKPIILVLNKIDLYTREEQERLIHVLRDERLADIIEKANFVTTKAAPRLVERVIETARGTTRSEWFTPPPDVTQLKARILEVLERDGLALLALNAAMYAADHSDRIASLRVQLRNRIAEQVIWSYAGLKAIVVGLNPFPVADVLGGAAMDIALVVTLAGIYGLQMSWVHARSLVSTILQAAGWTLLAVTTMHYASSAFKVLTAGWGTVLTAIPQGAAAGYGSYIVGQAAKFYFEHGNSWGSEGPKAVVQRLLAETDRQSVIEHLKVEIQKKLAMNRHARG